MAQGDQTTVITGAFSEDAYPVRAAYPLPLLHLAKMLLSHTTL